MVIFLLKLVYCLEMLRTWVNNMAPWAVKKIICSGTVENSFINRQLLTKFRTSDHCLLIETGRHKKKYIDNKDCTLFAI